MYEQLAWRIATHSGWFACENVGFVGIFSIYITLLNSFLSTRGSKHYSKHYRPLGGYHGDAGVSRARISEFLEQHNPPAGDVSSRWKNF